MSRARRVRIPSDAEWQESRIKALPKKWQGRLSRAWHRRSQSDYYGANVELREATEALLKVRVPLDATDADICDAAKQLAMRCMDRFLIFRAVIDARSAMERICLLQGIEPPAATVEDSPAIARMTCHLWWRRKLRKHQGQTVEAAAVRLGYVNKRRDLYVSNERLAARLQQNQRNAAALEATTARNEDGEVFTLAELASKSTANKAIRRAELMTRISGFERYADREGHQGIFLTITCPSRFHRFMTVNGGSIVLVNPRYDPKETPRTGHQYLVKLWARARAALARRKIKPYGFRIAEPQHDGTPHWHLLVFCPAEQIAELIQTVRAYALQDSPDEPGAAQHRCDHKLIDKSRGTAAGYIAKYVAKNIDGEHVGDDLIGKPAVETAKRVEAWATTWRIRQFQQIGGAPVGVWRELRRIRDVPASAPEHLRRAHSAANKRIQHDGDERASVAWDDYCLAQGGATCGRKAAITLAKIPTEELGRYGDSTALRPIGVQTLNDFAEQVIFESNRRQWIIEQAPVRRFEWGSFSAEGAKPIQPWTSVNNCTDSSATAAQGRASWAESDSSIGPPPPLQRGGSICSWT